MATIELRQLTPDDWEQYRRVRLAALAEAPHAFGSTYETESSYTEAVWRDRLRHCGLIVAMVDDHVAGLAAGVRNRDQMEEAMLISMWVDPATRGQGIGERLVNAVLDWTVAEGIARITLEVSDGNDAAERLYRRCGFERTGGVDHSDPEKPTFEMARHV